MSATKSFSDIIHNSLSGLFRIQNTKHPFTVTAWTSEFLLTVYHALPEEKTFQLEGLDGQVISAEVVAVDPRLDLALLKVTDGTVEPLNRSKTVSTRPGDMVLALGISPRHGGVRSNRGMISSVGGQWTTSGGGKVDCFLEVDGELPWGSSGGPLLSTDGDLIGLNTHALVRGGTTLSVKTLERAVKHLLEQGSPRRGWLGVRIHESELPADIAEQENQKTGLLILWRGRRSAAARAGMKVGDIILSIRGSPVSSLADLREVMSASGGQEISIRYIRAGSIEETTTTVKEKTTQRHRKWWPCN